MSQVEYHVALQGAGRQSAIVLSDAFGNIKYVKRDLPPLSMRINPRFRDDLHRSLVAIAELAELTLQELAANTRGLCIAMSGLFQDCDIYSLKHILCDIAFTGNFSPVLCEDVWAILASANLDAGVVVLAATGANVLVCNKMAERFIRVGGWGSELADLGSGYHIGKQAIMAVLDGADGRRPGSSALAKAVLDKLGLTQVDQIVPWYYAIRNTPNWRAQISDLAIPVVSLAEKEHEPQSLEILMRSIYELNKTIESAIHRAWREDVLSNHDSINVVLAGGLFAHSAIYRDSVELLFRASGPERWQVQLADVHPVVGAVLFSHSGKRGLPLDAICRTIRVSAATFNLCFGG